MNKYLILDCFVDEPACFGVPPFISPYPRYIYGALVDAGVDESNITYITIDSLRDKEYLIDNNYSMVFLIGGAIVPGKYLGYKIGTYTEIKKIISANSHVQFTVGGLVSHQLQAENSDFNNIYTINKDIEFFAYNLARNEINDGWRSVDQISRWGVSGARVVKQHPDFPVLIAEMETYRGCRRESHCSFCSEKIFKDIYFREQEDILNEIDSLIENGISRFRMGRQADILAYKSSSSNFKNGFPAPDPAPVVELFNELQRKKEAGHIRLLNIDNANPGTIINFPEESEIILDAIVRALTPGDTIPLGVESLDEKVLKINNLKVTPDELHHVIKIINNIGGIRVNNLPVLLPGINLIHGLPGESKNTFKINYETLLRIKDDDLLVKRINIRKIAPFPGTKAAEEFKKIPKMLTNRYEFYKEKIRKEIDHFMLQKVYPVGTVLDDLRVEDSRFDYSYARQIASYAITAKIPMNIELKKIFSMVIAGHRERSIIGFPMPINVNNLNQKALELIPGIGKKAASELILKRPFSTIEEVKKIAPSIDGAIMENITI